MTRPIADDEPTVVIAAAPRAAAPIPLAADVPAFADGVGDGRAALTDVTAPTSVALAVTDRLPMNGPVTPIVPPAHTWAERRAVNREWTRAERASVWSAGGSESGTSRFRALGATLAELPTTVLPGIPHTPRSSAREARRQRSRHVSYPVLAVLLLLSLVVGFAGTRSILQLLDAKAAASDAKAQLAFVEGALNGGDPLQTDRLTAIQAHLRILENDITRTQDDVPLQPLLSSNSTVAGALHLLAMAQDLARAGDRGVSAALILIPSLKGILHGLSGSGSGSGSGARTVLGALSAAQLDTAAGDVNAATALLQQALVQRAQVRDSDLQSLGLSSAVPLLHKLDAETSKLNAYLGQAHTLMAALPALLGIGKPINYLLFNMDSDELRPTGGFLGNYALLTVSGGKLDSGVHLHDVMDLDCPNSNCYPRALPPQFAWFPFANVGGTQIFDVRDSNLDPDFPASAQLAEQFAQEEGTPALGGVIAMTPGFIEQVLSVTGPIQVAPFGVTVTAANLQDEIHYYHILNAYCVGYPEYPACAQLDNPALQQYQTSGRKVFDAVLGSALLHTLGTLPPGRQSALFKVIISSLQSKDLQVYINDPQVEALLASFHVDSAVRAPSSGDSLFVVDANIGATYVNGDVRERAQDTITLDTRGTATHDLTLTYEYPIVPHIWSDIYPAAGGSFRYRDVARVIVPQQAQLDTASGCFSPGADAPEPDHAVFVCEFMLYRPDTLTLRFHWTVPHATVTTNGVAQYALLQKQAGTRVAVSVTILLPAHTRLIAAPQSPLTASGAGSAVQFAGILDKDTSLVVAYQ